MEVLIAMCREVQRKEREGEGEEDEVRKGEMAKRKRHAALW